MPTLTATKPRNISISPGTEIHNTQKPTVDHPKLCVEGDVVEFGHRLTPTQQFQPAPLGLHAFKSAKPPGENEEKAAGFRGRGSKVGVEKASWQHRVEQVPNNPAATSSEGTMYAIATPCGTRVKTLPVPSDKSVGGSLRC